MKFFIIAKFTMKRNNIITQSEGLLYMKLESGRKLTAHALCPARKLRPRSDSSRENELFSWRSTKRPIMADVSRAAIAAWTARLVTVSLLRA